MLYPFLLGQQQLYPGLSVSYRFAFSHEVVQDVLAGRYDLGIVTEALRQPNLKVVPGHREPLCLVVPADFAGNGLAELMGISFINYFDGFNHASAMLRSNFPQEFRSMSHFRNQGFTNEVGMVLEAVARGLGFTVVSRLVLETSPWQRQVKELDLAVAVHETLHLVTLAGSEMPRRYERLLEDFREQRRQVLPGFGELPSPL